MPVDWAALDLDSAQDNSEKDQFELLVAKNGVDKTLYRPMTEAEGLQDWVSDSADGYLATRATKGTDGTGTWMQDMPFSPAYEDWQAAGVARNMLQ